MINRWGFGKTDITPGQALELEGFAGPYREGARTISPLYARCAVCIAADGKNALRDAGGFSAGEASAAVFVACDLIGLSLELSDRLRAAAAKAAGTDTAAVMVCCTHTHSGPLTGISEARDTSIRYPELYPEYYAELEAKIVNLVGECVRSARPARLFYSFGRSNIASNRHAKISKAKNPLTDRSLRVLRVVGEDGQNLGLIVQAAAHPVFFGSDSNAYCSEWPGAFCRKADAEYGAALYIQGGCGDLSPLRLKGSPEANIEALSDRLIEEVKTAIASGESEVSGPVFAACGLFAVPRVPHKRRVLEESEAYIAGLESSGDPSSKSLAAYLRSYFEKAKAYAEEGLPPRQAPLQVILLGELPVFSLPFEPFSAITLGIAREAGRLHKKGWAVTAGYANGDIGYLPTARAMREGGYESDTAPLFYSMYGTWAPSAPTVVKNALLAMYSELLKVAKAK